MFIKKLILSLLALTFFITGCATSKKVEAKNGMVEREYNVAQKSAQVVTSATYEGVKFAWNIIPLTMNMVLGGAGSAMDAMAGVEYYASEVYLVETTEEKLDTNVTLAKFFTSEQIALYKDKDNINYIFTKDKNQFFKNTDIKGRRLSQSKKNGAANYEVQRLPLGKNINLAKLIETFKKDKFGNYVFLGDYIVFDIEQWTTGFFSTTNYTAIKLIPYGANTMGVYGDKDLPYHPDDQMKIIYSKDSDIYQ